MFLLVTDEALIMYGSRCQEKMREKRKSHILAFVQKFCHYGGVRGGYGRPPHTLPWSLKGKLGNFFLLAQSFYWPQSKRSLNRQFSPKSPKVGKKLGQSVKKWPNKTPLASDLLWESTKSVIGAAVGIHQMWHRSCCGNPLFGNFSIWPTVGIHQFHHRRCCGNPSILS